MTAEPWEIAARREARQFVSADEIRGFSTIEGGPLVARALVTWGVILGVIGLWAATGHVATLVVGIPLVSAAQHALFLLAHEGAHFCVARDKRRNDLVSDLCFAGPIFYTTEKYREGHTPHHTDLGDHARDLERRTWVLLRGGHFARLLLRSLTGWTAARAIFALTPDKVGARQAPWRWLTVVGTAQSLLLAYCWGVGAPFAYLWLWLLPFCTLTNVLLILRAVAEHQPLGYAARAEPDEAVDLAPVLTRTFATGPLEGFFLAPIGAHHHEHHLFPSVPFMQLPRLHALLLARGYFDTPRGREATHARLLWQLLWMPAKSS
jgi:fatty acid desaturase